MVVVTRAMARMLKGSSPDPIVDTDDAMGEGAQSDHTEDSSLEWKIYSRGSEPRKNAMESSHKEALETTISFINMKEEEKKVFLPSKVREVYCRYCGTKGKWIRGKQDPKSGSWIWGCGTFTSSEGCSRTVTQGILFARAFGATDFSKFRKGLPLGVYQKLKSLDIRLSINTGKVKRPLETAKDPSNILETTPKRIEPAEVSEPPNEGIKSCVASIRALIAAAINLSKQATSLEETRVTHEILDKASTLLNRADAIVELERTRLMTLGPAPPARPGSYSQAASRGIPPKGRVTPPTRMTAVQMEARTSDLVERRRLACNALAWKRKAPVAVRMLKEGEKLEDGPLKENVEALEFAYVEGISRMRYSEARSLLRVAGVDTRAIRDISFVGGSVCSLLTEKAYKGKLVRTLTFEGSPLKVLENFDPMSKEHFKRGIPPSQIISPIDIFIKRAASAVANNRRLEVATKYQYQLPAEYREKLRLEIQKILEARKGLKKGPKKASIAPPPVVVGDSTPETGEMDTDP